MAERSRKLKDGHENEVSQFYCRSVRPDFNSIPLEVSWPRIWPAPVVQQVEPTRPEHGQTKQVARRFADHKLRLMSRTGHKFESKSARAIVSGPAIAADRADGQPANQPPCNGLRRSESRANARV